MQARHFRRGLPVQFCSCHRSNRRSRSMADRVRRTKLDRRSEENTSDLQLHSFSFFAVFFFNDTATTEIYTLSLHDAFPISCPILFMPSFQSPQPINGRPCSPN